MGRPLLKERKTKRRVKRIVDASRKSEEVEERTLLVAVSSLDARPWRRNTNNFSG